MLGGSLDVFVLPDVLRLVSRAGASGLLRLRRTGVVGALGFREGDVVGGELGSGPIEDEDGLLDAVLTLMDAPGGEFSLEQEPVREILRLGVDDLLVSVSERRARWNAIIAELGGLDRPIELVPQLPESAGQVTLDPVEWQIVALADGRRTLADVAGALGFSTFRTAAVLLEMSRAGLLEQPEGAVAGPAAPTHAAPVVVEVEDEEDADPVELLHELGSEEPVIPRRKVRPLTREEQRLNLRR